MERKNTGQRRRKYDTDFKMEMVRLVQEENRSVPSVARDFDVPEQNIYRWVQQEEEDSVTPFPGSGNRKPEDEDLHRLRKENRDLREERDILKKALAVFSRTPR